MSRYNRENPDEPIRHDWLSGTTNTSGKAHSLDRLLARINNNMKNLAKQIEAIKTNGSAGQQIFLSELAKECLSKKPRPVCPQCCEPMVRTTVKLKSYDVPGWLCKC